MRARAGIGLVVVIGVLGGLSAVAFGGAAGGVSTCTASALKASDGGPAGGAAGTLDTLIRLRNTGSATCKTHGFATLVFLGTSGQNLGAHVKHDTTGGSRTVVLAHNQSTWVNILYADPDNLSPPCQTIAAKVEVTPPQTTTVQTVKLTHHLRFCTDGIRERAVGPKLD